MFYSSKMSNFLIFVPFHMLWPAKAWAFVKIRKFKNQIRILRFPINILLVRCFTLVVTHTHTHRMYAYVNVDLCVSANRRKTRRRNHISYNVVVIVVVVVRVCSSRYGYCDFSSTITYKYSTHTTCNTRIYDCCHVRRWRQL